MFFWNEKLIKYDITKYVREQLAEPADMTLAEAEKCFVLSMLKKHKTIAKTHKVLNVTRATVYARLKTHNIVWPFKKGKD